MTAETDGNVVHLHSFTYAIMIHVYLVIAIHHPKACLNASRMWSWIQLNQTSFLNDAYSSLSSDNQSSSIKLIIDLVMDALSVYVYLSCTLLLV